MSYVMRGLRGFSTANSGIPDWVAAGALAYLDFVNGLYWADDAERALSDVMAGIGSGVTAGSGIQVTTANSNRPEAAGVFKTALQSGMTSGLTLYQEWSHTTAIDGPIFRFQDAITSPTDHLTMECFGTPTTFLEMWDDDTDMVADTPGGAVQASGTEKLAVTIALQAGANFRYGLSLNGSAMTGGAFEEPVQVRAFNMSAAASPSFRAHFMAVEPIGWRYQPSFLRKLVIWNAQPTADLPSISVNGQLP